MKVFTSIFLIGQVAKLASDGLKSIKSFFHWLKAVKTASDWYAQFCRNEYVQDGYGVSNLNYSLLIETTIFFTHDSTSSV